MQEPRQAKWYYNVWFVLAMLFFVLGPFGLPLVWKNPRFGRATKSLLTIIMALYTIVLVQMGVRTVQIVTEEMNNLRMTFPY